MTIPTDNEENWVQRDYVIVEDESDRVPKFA